MSPDDPKKAEEAGKLPSDPTTSEEIVIKNPGGFFFEPSQKFEVDTLGLMGNLLGYQTIPARGGILTGRIFPEYDLTPPRLALSTEINDLQQEIAKQSEALKEQKIDAKKKDAEIERLRLGVESLQQKLELSSLLNQVGGEAQEKLLQDKSFQSEFSGARQVFVMSVDIRRSTELMLKAREPKFFADFITSLCSALRLVILKHNGIFDKFTGDGILAYFPDFYSGSDAGYRAVHAANDCHEVFKSHYKANWKCFTAVLSDAGLGIGIDAGSGHLVRISSSLTVVGTPVVYACRLAGAPAGITLLNQPAYDLIFERYSGYCTFQETRLTVKNEGDLIAHQVTLNGKAMEAAPPSWQSKPKDETTK